MLPERRLLNPLAPRRKRPRRAAAFGRFHRRLPWTAHPLAARAHHQAVAPISSSYRGLVFLPQRVEHPQGRNGIEAAGRIPACRRPRRA